MKINTSYFEKVEDKYVFQFSRLFWHLLIFCCTIALIAGVGLLIYSIFPRFKEDVPEPTEIIKRQYPPAPEIKLEDLKLSNTKVDIKSESKSFSPPTINEVEVKRVPVSADEKDYIASLDILKRIIPEQYVFKYPQGEAAYNFTKDERYRIKVDLRNIENRLDRAFRLIALEDNLRKKEFVDSVISFLRNKPMVVRTNLFDELTLSRALRSGILESQYLWVSAWKITSSFNEADRPSAFGLFFEFNQTDSIGVGRIQDLILKAIINFEDDDRLLALGKMASVYQNDCQSNIDEFINQTQAFLALSKQIDKSKLMEAYNEYFSLYLIKNQQRLETIKQIELDYAAEAEHNATQYKHQLLQAENEYNSNLEKLKDIRNTKALPTILASFLGLVFITVFLIFISIQSSIRKIERKLEDNN
jgi:hypothetical protein